MSASALTEPRRAAALPALLSRPSRVLAILLVVVAVYWLWYGLSQRSIFQDEGISLLAAQGISEQGVPRLPSGFIYARGYLPNYLVGGAIRVLGANQLSIMLPSLLMGLGSLWLVYLFAKDALRRPWLGIVTVAILSASQMQALYATSPRMYMALQFFAILAVYSAWRGAAERDRRWWLLSFLAIAAAIFSHKQGLVLMAAIPASLIVTDWASRHGVRRLISINTLIGLCALAAVGAFALTYVPADVAPMITAYSFGSTEFLGLRLGIFSFLKNGLGLNGEGLNYSDLAQYAVGFAPAFVFLVVSAVRRRWRDTDPIVIYLTSIITLAALANLIGTSEPYFRMWFFVMPFYALLLGIAGGHILTSRRLSPRLRLTERKYAFLSVAVAVAALATVSWVFPAPGNGTTFTGAVSRLVGPPCRGSSCDKSVKEHYSRISARIQTGDLIVSSNPFVTSYYLGTVHRYLRDKFVSNGDGTVTTFDYLEDEYFGVPLVDHKDLVELLNGERRVWVITDERVEWISSPEVRDILATSYTNALESGRLTTYVNHNGGVSEKATN